LAVKETTDYVGEGGYLEKISQGLEATGVPLNWTKKRDKYNAERVGKKN
jgi:hypothetical protein